MSDFLDPRLEAITELTAALDEFERIKVQLRESLAVERTATFYSLVELKDGDPVARVIQLTGGFVVVHWTHDPISFGVWTSMDLARRAIEWHGRKLQLENRSERVSTRLRGLQSSRSGALTPSERAVLRELRKGATNAEIAWATGLKIQSVKNHLSNIYYKIRARSRVEAVLFGQHLNLDEPDDEGDR